jgi:hypothetical protein
MLQDFRNTKDVENYEVVDEKIYYNLKLYNDGDDFIAVRFNINRVDSIIENNTQEWELGVENFSVPTYAIPILLTEKPINVTAGSFIIGQTYSIIDPGTTDFTLIGANNNNIGTSFIATGAGAGTGIAAHVLSIFFVQIENSMTNQRFSARLELYSIVGNNIEVYDYESIVFSVNKAIALSCSQFGLTEFPFILYNGSGSFDFYFPPLFTSDRQNPLIFIQSTYKIRFNLALQRLFSCFESDPDGYFESSLRQGENLVTWDAVDYAVRKSQWDPRPAMIRWTRILFLTDTIPIKDELLGSENQKMQSQILDYIINNRILDTTNINYFPQYVKWNNLINSSDLRRMTVRVILEYEDGTLYPLQIVPRTNFFMKLVFRRKNNGLMIK